MTDQNAAKVVPIKGGKCPSCGKPVVHECRPFCSTRCANLDLGRWLNEEYRLPAVEDDERVEDAFEGE